MEAEGIEMRDPFNNSLFGWVHRRECAAINCMVPAVGATLRYIAAWAVPFHDGDAPGRAYTEFERRSLSDHRYFKRRKFPSA